MTLKINKERLKDLVRANEDDERFIAVQNEISDHGRWTIQYDCVIKDLETGKFYDASYEIGATEGCEMAPFENEKVDEDGNLTLSQVLPYKLITTRYRHPNKEQS